MSTTTTEPSVSVAGRPIAAAELLDLIDTGRLSPGTPVTVYVDDAADVRDWRGRYDGDPLRLHVTIPRPGWVQRRTSTSVVVRGVPVRVTHTETVPLFA